MDEKNEAQMSLKLERQGSEEKSVKPNDKSTVVAFSEKIMERHRSYVADQLKKLGH